MRQLLTIMTFTLLCTISYSQTAEDNIIGQYWTESKEGKIEVFKEDNKYFGKIIWRKDARLDTENPNKNLRSRSVIGIVFMKDFIFNGLLKYQLQIVGNWKADD